MLCASPSFLAYLCLKKGPRANTRLFFGVEQKTQTKKPPDTENL